MSDGETFTTLVNNNYSQAKEQFASVAAKIKDIYDENSGLTVDIDDITVMRRDSDGQIRVYMHVIVKDPCDSEHLYLHFIEVDGKLVKRE